MSWRDSGPGDLGPHQPALGDVIGRRLHAGPSRSGRRGSRAYEAWTS